VLADRPKHATDLPTSFRGYDRDAIDRYLEQVEAAYHGMAAESEELRAHIDRLTVELKGYQQREQQVKERLAHAEQVAAGLKVQAEREIEERRAEFEREVEEERAALEREKVAAETDRREILAQAEAVRTEAQGEADAILHGARMDAERLTHELTARANAQSQAAERVLDDTRARLAAMVTELIKQLPVGSAGTPGARPPQ